MDSTLHLLTTGGGDGSGGGVFSGGSMSTVSKEDNLVLFSDGSSSSYPDESELELGLGLSLGGGGGAAVKSKPASWGQYSRILTAKDFPCLVSKSSSPSSSTSSSSLTKTKPNASVGTKRTADSVSPTRNGVSQVVGWPPIRAHRMNSLVNQSKTPIAEEFDSKVEKSKSKNSVVDRTNDGRNKNNYGVKEKILPKTSQFVKVNMDGIPIGRKVDLNAHSCYETLALTLEDMFCRTTTTIGAGRSSIEEQEVVMTEVRGPSKLLNGSSDFLLIYEDKEGDWMLVGDVPWGMFLSSVKRLRIMRTSEANNGLAPRYPERNGRPGTKPI